MDWRDIPSLAALRAFEAAARHGSHTAAARELNVTHAAVAQHVRALETHFGTALLERSGRTMTPTESGFALAAGLARGFEEIAASVRSLAASRGTGPLALTTTRTFAENWLMPRLPGFWSAHPDIPLSIFADDAVHDIRREGLHMAIRYGRGNWPGVTSQFLFSGQTVVVAHPDLAGKIDRTGDVMGQLAKLPWLVETGYTDYFAWIAAQGLPADKMTITQFDGNPLVLAGTRAGAGVSVQPKPVVEADLDAGRLVALVEEPVASKDGPGYYIVTPPGPEPERVRAFRRWLSRSVRSPDPGTAAHPS
ncbi:LysR family transcriptional regulator [Rhodobacterales bacterium HKCCE3408]|nr:LysR family transcriptional regulator [Rhodobacterales bacterium HKCCE3408]